MKHTTYLKSLVLVTCALLTGCALFSEKKFETGGAYAQTETQAAQPELYAADSAFDLAFQALDLTFKYEKANRAALWTISPKIKHNLDKLRAEASTVWLDYASARQAYIYAPTPANLTALQTVASKLQQLNGAALAVIAKKGEQ